MKKLPGLEHLFLAYRTIVLLLFTCLFYIPTVEAQDYIANIQHFGIEEGLSHRDVKCIHQDRQGFMWFGTKYGLNRFDGSRFKWFTKESNGLQSNEINHILEDSEGRMWLINTGLFFGKAIKSIDIFDSKTEKVQSFEAAFGNQAPFSPTDIVSFNRNSAGHLVFLTRDNHLVIYDGRFQSIPIQLDAYGSVLDIHWSPASLFWLVVRSPLKKSETKELRVLIFDEKGKEVRRFVHKGFEYALVFDLDEMENGRYIAKPWGLNKIHFFQIKPDGTQQTDSITAKAFRKRKVDIYPFPELGLVKKQGQLLWEYINSDLQVFGMEGKIKIQGESALNKIELVTDIFFDKTGQTWLSTQFGIYYIRLKANHFSKIFHNYQGKSHPIRKMVVDEENTLWVVEEAPIRNLWKVHLKTGAVSQVNDAKNKQINLPFPNIFYTLIKGKTGHLYYSDSNNLIKFDPKTYKHTIHKMAEPNEDRGFTWAIYEDESGKIWYTNDLGNIGYWDGEKSTWLPPLDSLHSVKYSYHFLKDQTGKTWLASDGGLFVLDSKKGKITDRFWSGGEGERYFPFDNIYHIHEDADGSFWLATGGTGLVHWWPPALSLAPPPDPLKGELPPASVREGGDSPFRGAGGSVDLIISDLMMPVMDGFQFLEKVKSDDRWRHIPVIMLTAKVNVKTKLRALRIGVDDYLTKPFQEEELKARIANLLNNYRKRMELSSKTGIESSKTSKESRPVIAQVDADWLEDVENIFAIKLADHHFTMEWVALKLTISQRQFIRRLKKLTGLTPTLYLREMRLQTARNLLDQGQYRSVKETSQAVGFADAKYFSNLFQNRFGVPPSFYLR